MLRGVLLVAAVLLFIGGICFWAIVPSFWPAGVEAALFGALIVLGLFFDRYRKRIQESGDWEPTGERFVDPATGKLVEVRYNPKTGERDYREP